jgi:DNA invertase Pin-like site-specific DNA recombinase
MTTAQKLKEAKIAITYIYTSSEKDGGASAFRQAEANREKASERGAQIVMEFEDRGVKQKMENRYAGPKMLHFIKGNSVDYIIAAKPSRFSRYKDEYASIIHSLERHGAQVEFSGCDRNKVDALPVVDFRDFPIEEKARENLASLK